MERAPGHKDHTGLHHFGYAQRLERSLGRFALFAVGYSFMSVLTGLITLFALGWAFSGPTMIWPYIGVAIGQLLMTLLFMELAAQYPLAGAIYNWVKALGAPTASWLAGWMVFAQIFASLASVALVAQIILPSIWSGFQVIGTGATARSYTENAVLLGGVMLLICTVVNCMRTQILAIINNVAVVAEVIGCLILVVLFLTHGHQSPTVFGHTEGEGAGVTWGVFGALLISSFVGTYQFLASDEAASLAEESHDPRRRAPRAMMQAYMGTMGLGILVLGVAILAIPNLHDAKLGALGLPYLVTAIAGATWGRVVLGLVFIAVFGCCLAVQAAGARMLFGMARDGRLPFSRQLATISKTNKSVPLAAWVVGLIAIALLAINIGATQIVSTLTSSSVAFCLVAYLCVAISMLRARTRGVWPIKSAKKDGYFTLGRWGMPINVLMVIWTVALLVNTLWPRASVYNAVAPFHWYLRYAPIMFTGGFAAIGMIYHHLRLRGRVHVDTTLYEASGVRAESAIVPSSIPVRFEDEAAPFPA